MSKSENNKKKNAFITAHAAGCQPLPPPPDIPRESLRALVQMPLNLTGGLTCQTSPNAKTKKE